MSVTILNKDNFETEISTGVYVVDFWAEWCGPCQMMLPILSDFAGQVKQGVKVGKVNVDECPEIASQFRIMSIPTILIFKDGKLVEQLVGVQQIETLNQKVEVL